jgi:hypothetical protein
LFSFYTQTQHANKESKVKITSLENRVVELTKNYERLSKQQTIFTERVN